MPLRGKLCCTSDFLPQVRDYVHVRVGGWLPGSLYEPGTVGTCPGRQGMYLQCQVRIRAEAQL
jgi:hypothetical protein